MRFARSDRTDYPEKVSLLSSK